MKNNSVELSGIDAITVEIGTKLQHSCALHGSVGITAEYSLSDTSILKFLGTDIEYLTPENMKKPGWKGGDKARGHYFFEAVKQGITTLSIIRIFRGRPEKSHEVTITVR